MSNGTQPQVVFRAENLTVHYETGGTPVVAVNRVGFEVFRGEILGLVGESGCGKSTTAMAILRLLQTPGRVVGGRALLNDVDVLALGSSALRAFRWRQISLIPQGAMNALNPVMRIGRQMADAIDAHPTGEDVLSTDKRVGELLDLVGLSEGVRGMFPHELSGGMKQRVCIAMAVALKPPLVIADEPTSALDVVVQRLVAQNLLNIKETLGNSMILIGHDMGLMAQLTDRVAVMYAGLMVEIAPTGVIFAQPSHPYTRQLIDSVPAIGVKKALRVFSGGPPDLRNLPTGCPFAPRCDKAFRRCSEEAPLLRTTAPNQRVACHLYDE